MNELEKMFGKAKNENTSQYTSDDKALMEIREHLEKLKKTEEVIKLADTISIDDADSIIKFADDVSEKISAISKEIKSIYCFLLSHTIYPSIELIVRLYSFSNFTLALINLPSSLISKLTSSKPLSKSN